MHWFRLVNLPTPTVESSYTRHCSLPQYLLEVLLWVYTLLLPLQVPQHCCHLSYHNIWLSILRSRAILKYQSQAIQSVHQSLLLCSWVNKIKTTDLPYLKVSEKRSTKWDQMDLLARRISWRQKGSLVLGLRRGGIRQPNSRYLCGKYSLAYRKFCIKRYTSFRQVALLLYSCLITFL